MSLLDLFGAVIIERIECWHCHRPINIHYLTHDGGIRSKLDYDNTTVRILAEITQKQNDLIQKLIEASQK